MKERGIIFSAPMVRAILENRKTMTRRICKKASLPMKDEEPAFAVCAARESGWIAWFGIPDPEIEEFTKKAYAHGFPCPYGQPGEHLWVRETWQIEFHSGFHDIRYKADNAIVDPGTDIYKIENRYCWKWRASIYLPRWASRILLEITDVRVERLQEISEEDAIKEGMCPIHAREVGCPGSEQGPIDDFAELWDSLNKKFPWSSNPWVWCISFKVLGK